MSVVPSGIFSVPLDKTRDLIAASATFRSWVGAGDSSAAKARTYVWAVNDTSPEFPLAIIGIAGLRADKESSSVSFDMELSVEITLYCDAASMEQGTPADEQIVFQNDVGKIIGEMRALQAGDQGVYPAMVAIESLDWSLPDPDNAGGAEQLYGATVVYTAIGPMN